MILDQLDYFEFYTNIHPLFPAACRHLRQLSLRDDLQAGRIELEGESLYAVVIHSVGKPCDSARTETHRRYIDVQYTLAGTDLVGWLPVSECPHSTGYDHAKDIEFYTDRPKVWFEIKADQFAVFFPHDAHAPMANEGQAITKIVLKIAV